MALTEETCAAPECEHLSTRNGEHVIPESLMRALVQAVWMGDEYIAGSTGAGVAAKSEQPMLIKLPCCTYHNNILSEHFEKDGQEAVKKFMGITSTPKGRRSTYDTSKLNTVTPLNLEEATAFGCWTVKTLLLLHHPQIVWEMNGVRHVEESVRSQQSHLPSQVYSDLFNGDVPRGSHAWVVSSKDQDPTVPGPAVAPRVPLTTIDGNSGVVSTFGIGARSVSGGPTVRLQAVWQPNAIVVHPDEESGTAVRVWPRPAAGLRLEDLSVLNLEQGARFDATFLGQPLGRFENGRAVVLAEGLQRVFCSDHASGRRFYALPRLDDRTRVDAVRAAAEAAGLLIEDDDGL